MTTLQMRKLRLIESRGPSQVPQPERRHSLRSLRTLEKQGGLSTCSAHLTFHLYAQSLEITPRETHHPCRASRSSLFSSEPILLHQPIAWGTTLAKYCMSTPLPCWSWPSGHVGCNCEHQGQGEEALAQDRPGFKSQLGCDFEQINLLLRICFFICEMHSSSTSSPPP